MFDPDLHKNLGAFNGTIRGNRDKRLPMACWLATLAKSVNSTYIYVHMYLYRYTHMYKYTHLYTKKRKIKKKHFTSGLRARVSEQRDIFFPIL